MRVNISLCLKYICFSSHSMATIRYITRKQSLRAASGSRNDETYTNVPLYCKSCRIYLKHKPIKFVWLIVLCYYIYRLVVSSWLHVLRMLPHCNFRLIMTRHIVAQMVCFLQDNPEWYDETTALYPKFWKINSLQ